MANKLITEMSLPKSIINIFAARNIMTAKDALSLTEFELMELLDVGLVEVISAVEQISEIVSPPCQTALSLFQKVQNEDMVGYFSTHLKGLDNALCGGIPSGVLTELVGPAGIGKTQFCLKLSLLATLPTICGGLDGSVIYFDVESKFSSRRLIEIGVKSFPEVFQTEGLAKKMAGRILVLQPGSLSEFTKSLEQVKVLLFSQQVKLLIIDSMTALVSLECEPGASRRRSLGWHISFIKSLAEFSRIPVVATNQVRSQSCDEICHYSFEVHSKGEVVEYNPEIVESEVVSALGISWAHAVTIRLVLEDKLGERYIKVAKSPMSPPLAFPFIINSSGISLVDDNGVEMKGSEINAIHHRGLPNFIQFFNG